MKALGLAAIALIGSALPALAGEAPAQAQTAPPAPRGYVIFFDHGGAWIPEEAEALLPQVAEVYRRIGYAAVAIACYSDNVGSQDLNIALTQDRADRIKGDLVIYGVPEAAIAAVGKGFVDPLVPDAPLDVAVSNRRCTIDLG
ncbi:MAG: OmpA family protein [Alphaproteobacteria bacterium]|nr:OmpA family protein [Alphaproteobacteria bacterium]